jgi:uncharacterized protein (TIGR02266 family)
MAQGDDQGQRGRAAEQRQYARYELTAYVDCTGSEILLYHRIENISLGGICIQTSTVEKVGAMVDLVVNFPELDATLAAPGEVVWAKQEPPQAVGIRFIGLDEEQKALLQQYIDAVRE